MTKNSNTASKFAARFAGVATLALAILPVAALTTAAHAAPTMRVQTADVDLRTAAGRTTVSQRIDAVASEMCRGERSLAFRAACENGVRAEANEQLAKIMASRSSTTVLAAAR